MRISMSHGMSVKVAALCSIIILTTLTLRMFHQQFEDCQPPSINEIFHNAERSLLKAVASLPPGGTEDKYISVANIITARKENVALDSDEKAGVSLCSQCSQRNLPYIPKLAANYDGYLSIAVFTYAAKIPFVLKYLSALHYCDDNVSRKVDFHLCVALDGIEQFTGTVYNHPDRKDDISCDILSQRFDDLPVNFADPTVTYPINTLRNLGITNAHTEFILSLDIDHLPSKDVNKKFKDFIDNNREIIDPKTAFVLPAFETNVPLTAAITKEELLYRWTEGTIRPFFANITFNRLHANTDYTRWRSVRIDQTMHVAYYRNWVEMWEPYYIARRNITPSYYENIKGFGYDRQSQLLELHVSGFQFAVLDDGFLVHDGFKERTDIYKGAEKAMEMNLRVYYEFKNTLVKKYKRALRTKQKLIE